MSELLSFQMVSMDSEEFSNMLMLHFIGIASNCYDAIGGRRADKL